MKLIIHSQFYHSNIDIIMFVFFSFGLRFPLHNFNICFISINYAKFGISKQECSLLFTLVWKEYSPIKVKL